MWTALSVRQMLRSRFYLILVLVQPLFFLTVAAWLSRGGGQPLAAAVAGSTAMGMWSATLFGAGRALQHERRAGTLELLLVSPRPLLQPVLGVCLGAAALGLVSAAGGLGSAVAFFGFRTGWRALAALAPALLIGMAGMAALGVLLSGLFVLLRQASMITNMLEYPVWFACALMVPAGSRPEPVALVGEFLAPTHLGALLRAALGEGEVDLAAAGKLVLLSGLYLALALAAFRRVGEAVRRRGDLAIV